MDSGPTRRMWGDLLAYLRCTGNEDDEGMAFIASTTPDPAWLMGCLAGIVMAGEDRDEILVRVMARMESVS